MPRFLGRVTRTLLIGAVVSGAVEAAWRLTGDNTRELIGALAGRRISNGETVDALVVDLASALLLIAVGALAAMVATSALAVLLRDRASWLSTACNRVSPQAGRRIVAACCGFGLAAPASIGIPALAYDGHRETCYSRCSHEVVGLGGLSLPDLPVQATPAAEGRAHQRGRIVVAAGDSLWRIAADRLPAAASDQEVVALVHLLYRLNHLTIGADPDLILPGMTLIAPEGTP